MKRLVTSLGKGLKSRSSLRDVIDIACLALLVMIGVQTAQAFLSPSPLLSQSLGEARQANKAAAAPFQSVEPLFFRALDKQNTSTAPRASVGNIKLYGTRPKSRGDGFNGMGTAIVSLNNKPQQVFKSGQNIDKGVLLTAVYADRIEISRNGKIGSVFLRPQKKARKLMKTPSPSGVPKIDHPAIAALDLRLTKSEATIGANAPQLLLTGLGLAHGDRIQSIDGKPLNETAKLKDVFNTALSKGLEITLMRNGASQTITLPASLLALALAN